MTLTDLSKKKLLDRYNRIVHANTDNRYLLITQLWNFLHSNESFKIISNELELKGRVPISMAESFSWDIIKFKKTNPLPVKEDDRILVSYFVLKELVGPNIDINEIYQVGRRYSTNKYDDITSYFSTFDDLFLQPLIYYYLDEITTDISIISLLIDYKKKVEWFRKQQLAELYASNTLNGEGNLTMNLYEFLFDNGVDITVEPRSPSGEVDFIVNQKNSKEKLIADGKIFDHPNRGKSYIIKGIGQILTYLKEYNETYGYLVIYKVCEENIEFNFNSKQSLIPYLLKDNKLIHFIVIDIHQNNTSASKRGIPKSITITDEDVNKI